MKTETEPISCAFVKTNLFLIAENSLEQEVLSGVSNHLAACPECARDLAGMKGFLNALATDRNITTNPYFTTRILARAEKQSSAPLPAGRLNPALFSVLVVLALVVGFFAGTILHHRTVPAAGSDRQAALEQFSDEAMISDLLQPEGDDLFTVK